MSLDNVKFGRIFSGLSRLMTCLWFKLIAQCIWPGLRNIGPNGGQKSGFLLLYGTLHLGYPKIWSHIFGFIEIDYMPLVSNRSLNVYGQAHQIQGQKQPKIRFFVVVWYSAVRLPQNLVADFRVYRD